METVRIEAHAKVNLGLAVRATRPDGFHEIHTVFQTIGLSDTVELSTSGRGITLSVEGAPLPDGEANLAWRAARLFLDRIGADGVSIHLTKRIPVAGGLGGGSADAAGVIVGLNELLRAGVTSHDLASLALSLGSDVPYLLRGGTVEARGRGELLRPMRPLEGAVFVLATPPFGVGAAEAYSRARIGLTANDDFIRLICSGIQEGDIEAVAAAMRNDLEDGVAAIYPEIRRVKLALLEAGCAGAVMSGSGSTVVGLVRTGEEADSVRSRLAGHGWALVTAAPVDAGCEVVGTRGIGRGRQADQ